GSLVIPGRDQEIRALVHSVAPCLPGTLENDRVRQAGDRFLAAVSGLQTARQQFRDISGRDIAAGPDAPDLGLLSDTLAELLNARHLLRNWSTWCRIRNKAIAHNLAPLVEQIEKGDIQPAQARSAFRLGYARWWLPKVLDRDPVLRDFRRFQHENAIKDFREIVDLARSHATSRVISALAHGLPAVQSVPRHSELGLLRHQMELKRPSQSIRDMISKMPESFSKLAPCML